MTTVRESTQVSLPKLEPNIHFEIIEDVLRQKYLSRLNAMQVVEINDYLPLRSDLISNVRLFKISEMVYPKSEFAVDKFYTVFSTLAPFRVSVFIIIDSDGQKTDFYIGIRNNESDEYKTSTVMFGNMLKDTLIGQFPGIKINSVDNNIIIPLSDKIASQHNIASVSVVASTKTNKEQTNEQFIQGLEKLVLAMQGKKYTGLIIAENQAPEDIQFLRRQYQELYTKLSPFQKVQISSANQVSWSKSFTASVSTSSSRPLSFSEMNSKQKAAAIGSALVSVSGILVGGYIGGILGAINKKDVNFSRESANTGSFIVGQVLGPLANFVNLLAPNEQISKSETKTESSTETSGNTKTISTTTENKMVTDLMALIDSTLKRIQDFDSYGMWNVAGYFSSHNMSDAEIAASNYRSLMSGENSNQILSAVNAWWKTSSEDETSDATRMAYQLSRFTHPLFCYGDDKHAFLPSNAATWVSGKELGLHLGFPRASIPGMPVTEHAEFGKEVYRYKTLGEEKMVSIKDRMTLGRVFDLGQKTDKIVELNNKSLNMHTFITGSTGSGKSNTVYQMLRELYQDEIPFLVIEPAKGEYKDVFGNWSDVNVYSTNPNIAELIKLNPFKFPKTIHILEHIDGLVEIFSVCWPMYDAMPAFFKDAILKSYEAAGWDLGTSTFDGEEPEYPDFDMVVEQLNRLIEHSDYASDIKSNYRGALITRVKSLTVGLNRYVFTSEQTPYEKLFDEYCILDISRVKSNETKALLMGLMVYMLNEYRIDQRATKKLANDSGLKHITVLEEAHNLLKNTTGKDSDLIGKSVEMLAQTIAEIRTYGEGFIIVDQSPSSVDISAIKNTNTKIVLRTPEKSDREAIGRSMGLSDDQVNEIARLPGGVAVVYQNDWVNPVLTMINKADVDQEPYQYDGKQPIMTLNTARQCLVRMLMRPWIGGPMVARNSLRESVKVVDLPRKDKILVTNLIDDYSLCGGFVEWDEKKMPALVLSVLGINPKELAEAKADDTLEELIATKLKYFRKKKLQVIYDVLKKALTHKEDKKEQSTPTPEAPIDTSTTKIERPYSDEI